MEIPDLIIQVKPDPDAPLLQDPRLGSFSPKELPALGGFKGASLYSPGSSPAGAAVHANGAWRQWAPWTPQVPNSLDHQPWVSDHPDLLTCGHCLQTVLLDPITAFIDQQLGCPLFRSPSRRLCSEHQGPTALSCLHCGREFPEAWGLLCHAQMDHRLFIYQTAAAKAKRPRVSARRSPTCPVCNKVLSSFSNLKVPVRSHAGERPYASDQCPYTCAQSSKLNRHHRLSPGGICLQCPHCCVPSGLHATVNKHLRQTPGGQLERLSSRHTLPCCPSVPLSPLLLTCLSSPLVSKPPVCLVKCTHTYRNLSRKKECEIQ